MDAELVFEGPAPPRVKCDVNVMRTHVCRYVTRSVSWSRVLKVGFMGILTDNVTLELLSWPE